VRREASFVEHETNSKTPLFTEIPMIRFPICGLVVLCAVGSASAQAPAADSVVEDEIWELEDAYWRYAADGDVENYLTLWHDDFVGWFCRASDPIRKANIGDWVRAIHEEGQELVYSLDNKTSQEFDGLVVVYYTTPIGRLFQDGSNLWEGEVFKVTHTWMKVADQWQIIGGMCGELGAPD
jgi:hypothetical protein